MQIVLKENNLEAYLDYFGLDRKGFMRRRYIMAFLFTMIYAISVLLLDKQLLFLAMPLVAFLGYKTPYFLLARQKKEVDLINSYLFPEFLTSFLGCLAGSSENVYQALRATLPYTKGSLKKKLGELVKSIQEGNNRQDYLDFAEYVGTNEAYMVMSMIYEFSVYGIKEEALEKLHSYIQNMNENKINELIETKVSKLDILAIGPIIISTLLFGGFAGTLFLYYVLENVVGVFNFM